MRHRQLRYRRWLAATALSAIMAGGAMWLYPASNEPTPLTDRVQGNTVGAATQDTGLKQQTKPDAVALPDDRNMEPLNIASNTPASLGPDPFAASLEGTDIDGALKADANGELIVDIETRDFFDYFLNAVGEVSPEEVLERIRTLAVTSLPAPAAEQAMALLDQYLHYKQQAMAVESTPLDSARQNDPAYQQEMLHKAFNDLKQLRQTIFSPEAHRAFFGLEEAYGEYTLATLEIARRTDLSSEAKTSLVAWHRNQLPEQLQRTERHLMESNQESLQRTEIMEAADSPESAGQKLMDQGMSREAATSVTAYLQEQKQFEARYEHYRKAIAQLRDSGLAEPDLAAQQAQLLNRHFPDSKQQTWARLKMLGSN
ncbi:hypothetical protein BKP64_17365 [Marinobacter salinus]|uniref:Lipase chaperone n=1 Tax=Marinobacter salinus TaxID=1874317 RepID=A0A1D9GQ99_9GAMM|nr:lipase secretion chaperone [Marinobacter salinus]AOY89797.1 hypothetical protein BKP64_17365 [Marinobacter salinus]